MNLALFDLDNTLIEGDSDHAWANFLISKKILEKSKYEEKNNFFFKQYNEGNLDIHKFLKFQFEPICKMNAKFLESLRNEFINKKIEPMIKKESFKLISSHNEDLKIIVTATNSFITSPIAKILGIKNLIATEPEIIDNKYTGNIKGIPALGDGKVMRLKIWLKKNKIKIQSFKDTLFYSDSHNDLPLMNFVKTPIAVDPDEKLKKYAVEKKWKIISLRGN